MQISSHLRGPVCSWAPEDCKSSLPHGPASGVASLTSHLFVFVLTQAGNSPDPHRVKRAQYEHLYERGMVWGGEHKTHTYILHITLCTALSYQKPVYIHGTSLQKRFLYLYLIEHFWPSSQASHCCSLQFYSIPYKASFPPSCFTKFLPYNTTLPFICISSLHFLQDFSHFPLKERGLAESLPLLSHS